MNALFILIPVLPLVASITIGLNARRVGFAAHRLGIPAVTLSFGLSLLALIHVAVRGPSEIPLYTFVQSGALSVELGLYLDQLAVVLLLLVTGVSSLVHVYAFRYMQGDPGYTRFFTVIALFTFAMLMVVLSRNLLMLFLFWEVMGLCSYLLISHWSDRQAAIRSATRAYLVNAVADVGFGVGILLSVTTFGTLDIPRILHTAPQMAGETVNLFGGVLGSLGLTWHVQTLTVIGICFLIGAMGKSAQFPFHVWLPFAMEAPTPVSALIHAATMVNAGVFLIARMSPLLLLAPAALTVIAVIGGITALFAGVVALTQTDIKRILVYSTMSQIGYMILACGLGAFAAAIFHLVAHGAYKAYFFLGSGSALQATHAHIHPPHRARFRSVRYWRLSLIALALAALPTFVIFSRPYETLWAIPGIPTAQGLFLVIALVTAGVTAWYLYNLIHGVWEPPRRLPGLPLEDERGRSLVTVPILAGLAVAVLGGGTVLLTLWTWFARFLAPAFTSADAPGVAALRNQEGAQQLGPEGSVLLLVALGVVVAGWGWAVVRHHAPLRQRAWMEDVKQRLYVWTLNKGYLDEIYDAFIVRTTLNLAHGLDRAIDRTIDGLILGLASLSVRVAHVLWRFVDGQTIDYAVTGVGRWSVSLAHVLWRVIDGRTIDFTVTGVGRWSVRMSKWLWQAIDVRTIERTFDSVGERSDATGQALQRFEHRMLQHHLVALIVWLAIGLSLLYWLLA